MNDDGPCWFTGIFNQQFFLRNSTCVYIFDEVRRNTFCDVQCTVLRSLDMSISTSLYGYAPSLGANIIFLLVAIAGLLAAFFITIQTQRNALYGLLISLACVLEIIGYSDHVYSHGSPDEPLPFLQSTIVLVMAPAFLSSGYVALLFGKLPGCYTGLIRSIQYILCTRRRGQCDRPRAFALTAEALSSHLDRPGRGRVPSSSDRLRRCVL